MDDDNEDMDLDFNPFDHTFENFENFDSQDVASLANELHFYEEKAEFLAGQGALEGFSFSRDAFSMHQEFFSTDLSPLDANPLANPGPGEASLGNLDLQFSGDSFRGFPDGRQDAAEPSKSAEERGSQRSGSASSLKRTLSEQGHTPSKEVHSQGSASFRGLSLHEGSPAVDSDVFGRNMDTFGQSREPLGRELDYEGGPQQGNEVAQLRGLDNSLLGALLEPRETEATPPFGGDGDSLFRFDSDSKPFEFGAAVFENLPNGTGAFEREVGGGANGGEGESKALPEPGFSSENAGKSTKANMWLSSDEDDRPIGSLKAATKAKRSSSSGGAKKSSRKRSAASLPRKMDPAEAARLEKNRIKAQRHRDKMKAWKEDVKTENEDLRAQREKLAEERESLAAGKASLEREKLEMERTLQRLQEEMSRLQSENARLWKENQELTKAAHARQRRADAELLREPKGEEPPRDRELQNLNDRLIEENSKLEGELALVKGALANQLTTMSNLVAIRPPKQEIEI